MALEKDCTKCHGEGIIKSYSHVAGGICFLCWGTGNVEAGKQEEKRYANARDAKIKFDIMCVHVGKMMSKGKTLEEARTEWKKIEKKMDQGDVADLEGQMIHLIKRYRNRPDTLVGQDGLKKAKVICKRLMANYGKTYTKEQIEQMIQESC